MNTAEWSEMLTKLNEAHNSSINEIEQSQIDSLEAKEKNTKQLELELQKMRSKRETMERSKVQKKVELNNSIKKTKQYHHNYHVLKARLQELEVVLLQEAQIQRKLDRLKQNPTPALLMTNKSTFPSKPHSVPQQQSYDFGNPTPMSRNTSSLPFSILLNTYQQPQQIMSVQLGGSDNSTGSGSGGNGAQSSYVFSNAHPPQSLILGQSSSSILPSAGPSLFSNPNAFLKKPTTSFKKME